MQFIQLLEKLFVMNEAAHAQCAEKVKIKQDKPETDAAVAVDVDSGCCYCCCNCCCCRAAPHSLNVFDIFYEHIR